MDREVKLSRVNGVLEELSYPISRAEATEELDDVTLLLADGEENAGVLLELTGSDSFESVDDLEGSLYSVLPRKAVGEPFQSEGEG